MPTPDLSKLPIPPNAERLFRVIDGEICFDPMGGQWYRLTAITKDLPQLAFTACCVAEKLWRLEISRRNREECLQQNWAARNAYGDVTAKMIPMLDAWADAGREILAQINSEKDSTTYEQ